MTQWISPSRHLTMHSLSHKSGVQWMCSMAFEHNQPTILLTTSYKLHWMLSSFPKPKHLISLHRNHISTIMLCRHSIRAYHLARAGYTFKALDLKPYCTNWESNQWLKTQVCKGKIQPPLWQAYWVIKGNIK